MPIEISRKSKKKIVLSTILASILLLPVIGSIPVKSIEGIMITNYTNAETANTEENVSSSAKKLNATVDAINNTDITHTIDLENKSKVTEEYASNLSVIFKDHFKNKSIFPFNFTLTNISSSNSAAATGSEENGDFNGDGFEDKAIGVSAEDIGTLNRAGVVQVIYGSPGGLSTSAVLADQLFTQESLHCECMVSEANDGFGTSLSSGDYNGDGKDDLAIGTPGEDFSLGFTPPITDGGLVYVMYGSTGGLSASAALSDQIWIQGVNVNDIREIAENGDLYGVSLSSGDYNGDGQDDLAVGANGEDIGTLNFAGVVNIIHGSPSGLLVGQPDQVWMQGVNGVDEQAEAFDSFGDTLSSGDYNGDGTYDLAIGAPGESIAASQVGKVHVIYGSSSGLSAISPITDQLWQQGVNGLDEVAEAGDFFGLSLSSADYNNDNRDDLAIAAPREAIAGETIQAVGKVHVIYGSSSGLSTTSPIADQLWMQGLNGLDDVAEFADFFGYSLSSGDYNNDERDDLAIGAFRESIAGETIPVGKVHVIYGSTSGLSTTSPIPDQLWMQGLDGLDDVAEAGDEFGSSLSSGDYNNDERDDLAIGATCESIAGETIDCVGKMHVIYGSSSGLSTTSPIMDQLWEQGVNGLDEVAEEYDFFG